MILFVCVMSMFIVTPLQAFSFEKAVVLDGVTGDVLFEHHAYEKSRVASLTKIMSAVVALEYGKLTDTTLVSQKAAEMTGSSVYLNIGQKVTLRDLLHALMLCSGNDASMAIAEMIGGSEAGFVYWYNDGGIHRKMVFLVMKQL
mgnify:CR=1 FL=1